MRLPTFVILGAQKSGTTSLYHYLGQHPEVFMPEVKEPSFLALYGCDKEFRGPQDPAAANPYRTLEAYASLFAGSEGFKAVGEASTLNLYYPTTIDNIQAFIPTARLVCILRNPVERAYSHYNFVRMLGREPLDSFEAAFDGEDARIREDWGPIWHYKSRGYYYSQLNPYFSAFPREQIKVYLLEDLKTDQEGTLRDLFRFVGVEASFVPPVLESKNVSSVPRFAWLNRAVYIPGLVRRMARAFVPKTRRERLRQSAIDWLQKHNARAPDRLTPFMRKRLQAVYREDIEKLQTLLNRDLSGWLRD